jgi:hypothetical protein
MIGCGAYAKANRVRDINMVILLSNLAIYLNEVDGTILIFIPPQWSGRFIRPAQ